MPSVSLVTVGRRFELQTIDAKPKKPVPERELHERPTELFSIPQHREHVIEPRDARAVAQVDHKLNDRRHVCRGWRRDSATEGMPTWVTSLNRLVIASVP